MVKTDELTIEAAVDRLDDVLEFVDRNLEEAECPPKVQIQIDVAVEEIFVNIANYAYTPKTGDARIVLSIAESAPEVSITFFDRGIPYNPLAKEDPDVTLSAEERKIGGLGIFMVKKSMDVTEYQYKEGQNVFTMRKGFASA
ncbi:MAG: ATP-binding protein [Lachnospiraceae bacterium]|nr:ATP-binding protein [Lachnospiraceae bacterium]